MTRYFVGMRQHTVRQNLTTRFRAWLFNVPLFSTSRYPNKVAGH
jgi:hypothetical protein